MQNIQFDIDQINFDKSAGLVPAIIQDAFTQKVLMLGYMDKAALIKTLSGNNVTFFSRSKNRLWTKGETSGNFLRMVDIKVDCDNDTLLIQAQPQGPACHTGADTCFKEDNKSNVFFLEKLKTTIRDRHLNPSDSSYTSSLFAKGINKVAQKVGEEAVEVVIEAKDDNEELFKNETADLLYHLLVLIEAKNVELNDVVKVLQERHS